MQQMAKFLKNVAGVIPVYNPEAGLTALCQGLIAHFPLVVVVDDGSDEHVDDFKRLPKEVVILRHEVNLGKGRAIKRAFEWLRQNHPEISGVVFADGDGQHRIEDIVDVAERMEATGHVTLGVRDFSKSSTPFRSRFGNVLTSFLVRLFFRIEIFDTQTGLRAIPSRLFTAMLGTPGERYEYEMRLFGMLRDHQEMLEQVPIQTIYIENNRASHFRPIRDSIRVYRGLFGTTISRFLKFSLSSLVGFGLDNLVFTVALYVLQSFGLLRRYDILIALVIARLMSATINYLLNRILVFGAKGRALPSFVRYWTLVLLIAALSYVGTALLSYVFDAQGIVITSVKVIVETVLFVLSYKVQKHWVFAGGVR